MTSTLRIDSGIAATGAQGSRRWLALVFVALAQLMIALDATIMNIALPSAQAVLRHRTPGLAHRPPPPTAEGPPTDEGADTP
jgi:hypothetical protein